MRLRRYLKRPEKTLLHVINESDPSPLWNIFLQRECTEQPKDNQPDCCLSLENPRVAWFPTLTGQLARRHHFIPHTVADSINKAEISGKLYLFLSDSGEIHFFPVKRLRSYIYLKTCEAGAGTRRIGVVGTRYAVKGQTGRRAVASTPTWSR